MAEYIIKGDPGAEGHDGRALAATERKIAEYIDKEALLRDIENSVVFSVRNAPSAEMRGAHKITERIKCAPAADVVEVKYGRWVEMQETIPWCEDDVDTFYVCSVCKCRNYAPTQYCPDCGAKMEAE